MIFFSDSAFITMEDEFLNVGRGHKNGLTCLHLPELITGYGLVSTVDTLLHEFLPDVRGDDCGT